MKTKLFVCVALVGLVAFGSGCMSFDKGGSSKAAWTDPDGSVHEKHGSWNISDPFTAIGKFLDVNVNVNTVSSYGGGYNSGYVESVNRGSYMDYRYNRWCTRGYHLEQRGNYLCEVRDYQQAPPPRRQHP